MKHTDCSVEGVYSTVHMDTGDIRTTEVTKVEVKGSEFWFWMLRKRLPRGGTFESTTLHVGTFTVRLAVQRTTVRKHDNLTVIQHIDLAGLERAVPA